MVFELQNGIGNCMKIDRFNIPRFNPFVIREKTRPDTRPIPVADGWAGAEMQIFALSNSIITNGPLDQWTDGPTDGRMDGRTKSLIGKKSNYVIRLFET